MRILLAGEKSIPHSIATLDKVHGVTLVRDIVGWENTHMNSNPHQRFAHSLARAALCAGALCLSAENAQARPHDQEDLRSYMHGIEAVKGADGRFLIFISSSGIPPKGKDENGNWPHDIYLSKWGINDARISPPTLFIQKPEAQEPVSVAQTTDGNVMLSFEDGWNTSNEVNQRYGVYDAKLRPIAPYPRVVATGGHSGHVAAAGKHFVVLYSEDWVNGGGVDDLGTGNGVYAKVFDSHGHLLSTFDVAPQRREWWPMIAGSSNRALLVWQQFVPDQTSANLKITVLDPETGKRSAHKILRSGLNYYTYKAKYIPSIDRFLVTGTTVNGKGFAYLINNDGKVSATLECMPATVRGADVVASENIAYTPSQDNRLLHLELTPSSIKLKAVQRSPLTWSYIGSLGLMRNPSSIHWISLTKNGVEETDFDLRNAVQPDRSDLCR
ncbi:hypothetical protein [Pseudomonas sp. MPC6]|uniref:hypothetical protein n=1 Tax=unclassified Pseudomonas TaxID=196821 RepID=UPI001E45F69F|nr:hypothetical protein [Pseudomonas sp. MPC6]